MNEQGAKLLSEPRLGDALLAFQNALALDPSFAAAAYNQEVILSRLGRTQEAIKALRTAIQLQPSFVGAHRALALVLKSANDPTAEEEMRKTQLLEQLMHPTSGTLAQH